MKDKNILVFGASIVHGYWDKEGGWVQRLRKFLDEKNLTNPNFYCSIYNLGISGNTTEDLLRRFEFETKQRFERNEGTMFLLSIGINDSIFVHKTKSSKLNPKEFQNNLIKIIKIARKYSQNIIFVGINPVDETKVDPIPWLPKHSYKNKYIREFNDILKSVCNRNKLHFIDIFDKFIKTDYNNLLEDGVHPNSKGHEKIFNIVKDFLVKNKIIK